MAIKSRRRFWSNASILGSFVCSLAGAGSSIIALRNNNIRMIEYYKTVQDADSSGADVTVPLKKLQSFVSGHMNATPPKLGSNPGVQLKNSYERAKQAETARASAERTRIYDEAVVYCESSVPGSKITERAQCIIDRSSAQPVLERVIVPDLYRYDFVSPGWTPDVAGWSIIFTGFAVLALLLSLAGRLAARLLMTK